MASSPSTQLFEVRWVVADVPGATPDRWSGTVTSNRISVRVH